MYVCVLGAVVSCWVAATEARRSALVVEGRALSMSVRSPSPILTKSDGTTARPSGKSASWHQPPNYWFRFGNYPIHRTRSRGLREGGIDCYLSTISGFMISCAADEF